MYLKLLNACLDQQMFINCLDKNFFSGYTPEYSDSFLLEKAEDHDGILMPKNHCIIETKSLVIQ